MEKIVLTNNNRDGSEIWFEHVEGNVWTIKASKEYVLEYACQNYEALPEDATEYDFNMKDQFDVLHKGHTLSFDPAGGPYIALNSEWGGYKVNRIYYIENTPGVFFNLEKIS